MGTEMDFSDRKRSKAAIEEFDYDDENAVEETPEEKRLRLAQIYLEEIKRREEEAKGEETLDHDEVNKALRQDELEENQRAFKPIAENFDSFGEISRHNANKVHKKSLTCVVKSPNGKYLFTASKDGGIGKWRIQSDGRPQMVANVKSAYKELVKKKNKSAKGHKSVINAMAVSSDNKFLASGDDDNLIFIWKADSDDANRLECVKIFRGHRGPVLGLAFAKNKNVLYSCSQDRSVKTWDLDQMGYVETLFGHQDAVTAITSGVTCDFLTGGGKDGTVRLWKTAEEVQLIFNLPKGSSVEALDKINSELFVSVGDNGQISVWSSRKKSPAATKPSAHGQDESNDTPNWISSLGIVNMSDLIATGSHDGYVRLWRVDPKKRKIEAVTEIPLVGFVNAMTFSNDGKFLYAAVGQEHRRGRWWQEKSCKNQLICIPLNYENSD